MKYLSVVAVLMIGSMAAYGLSPGKYMNANSNDFLLGVYPGSRITSYFHNDSIETVALHGLNSYEDPNTWDEEAIQGENTVVVYDLPHDVAVSTQKVFQSLVSFLEKKGATQNIKCSGVKRECGYYFPRKMADSPLRESYYRKLSGFSILNYGDFYFYTGDFLYESETYVVTIIVSKEFSRNIQYSVDLTKISDSTIRQLVGYKEVLSSSIEKTGKAILGGLYFEVDQIELTMTSVPSLEKISEYLSENKGKTFLVVGHTDSTGSAKYNLNLSEGRAAEVVRRLGDDFGVDKNVLQPVGLGMKAPIAPNTSASGRAENRRVELVLSTSSEGEIVRNYQPGLASLPTLHGEKVANDAEHKNIELGKKIELTAPIKSENTQ